MISSTGSQCELYNMCPRVSFIVAGALPGERKAPRSCDYSKTGHTLRAKRKSCSTGSALRDFSRFLYMSYSILVVVTLAIPPHVDHEMPMIYYRLTIYSRVYPNGKLNYRFSRPIRVSLQSC